MLEGSECNSRGGQVLTPVAEHGHTLARPRSFTEVASVLRPMKIELYVMRNTF